MLLRIAQFYSPKFKKDEEEMLKFVIFMRNFAKRTPESLLSLEEVLLQEKID